MGLNKTIISRSGQELKYWKIATWRIDMPRKMVSIMMVPYSSKEARDEGLEPIYEERISIKAYDRMNNTHPEKSSYNYTEYFSPNALESAGMDIYKVMYKYIKEKAPGFEGAEDAQ